MAVHHSGEYSAKLANTRCLSELAHPHLDQAHGNGILTRSTMCENGKGGWMGRVRQHKKAAEKNPFTASLERVEFLFSENALFLPRMQR